MVCQHKGTHQIGADKNAQRAKAKNVKRIKTAVISFSALAAKNAQQEWERFAEAPNVDTWHAVYAKAFPLFRDIASSLQTGEHHQTSKD